MIQRIKIYFGASIWFIWQDKNGKEQGEEFNTRYGKDSWQYDTYGPPSLEALTKMIAGEIQQGELLNNYLDKGRFRELLQTFPVSIVMNAQVGLLGASLQAQKLEQSH